MYLISDSGSTKADWILAEGKQKIAEFTTPGFNPMFHHADFIQHELGKIEILRQHKHQVKQVSFYGAGCSSESRNKVISDALSGFFENASVEVDHDMLGAAIAACRNSEGLVSILGTGSNIAYWSGCELLDTRHGMGYILGDEASGSYFGKKLIASFLYQTMPEDLRTSFYSEFKIDKESAIENVYHKPNANVYLASHARFLSLHSEHPFILRLIESGFQEFFDTNISAWQQYKSCPVHFIGSIAHHFRGILQNTADKNGFTIGKIIVKPIEDMFLYFSEKE